MPFAHRKKGVYVSNDAAIPKTKIMKAVKGIARPEKAAFAWERDCHSFDPSDDDQDIELLQLSRLFNWNILRAGDQNDREITKDRDLMSQSI